MNIHQKNFTVKTDGTSGKQLVLSSDLSMFDAVEAALKADHKDVVIVNQISKKAVAFYSSHTKTVIGLMVENYEDFPQSIRNLQGL